MGFFDFDPNDPDYQRMIGTLAGMANGFAQAGMPSRTPIGTGVALGMGGSGAVTGAQDAMQKAQAYQTGQIDQASKTLSFDQQLAIENMLRQALGKPQITAQDLQGGVRSPLFGLMALPAMQQTNVPTGQAPAPQAVSNNTPAVAPPASSATDPEGNPISSYGSPPAPAAPAPGQPTPASPTSAAIREAIVNKMLFGVQPTDYQKAKIYADSLPEGPAKVEAEQAASKAAGIDVSPDARSGAIHLMWDPEARRYKVAFRNPNLPEGYTLNDDGQAVPVGGGPAAVSDIATREAGAKAGGTMKVDAFNNWLETGGNGMGTATGDVTQPGAGPSPTYSARVAQLEGGGNPNPPPNPGSTAGGPDQFLNGTWLQKAKQFLPPELLQGKTDDQIMAMRTNPDVSAMVTNGYARENQAVLTKAGIKNVGAPELYLAHHFGPGGAQAILRAAPNTPIEQVLSPEAMAANPELKGATVADVYSHARRGMSGIAAAPNPEEAPGPQLSGNYNGVKTKIPDVSEQTPINKGEVYLKARIPEWAHTEEDWADVLPSNQIGEQRALAIAEALKATQAGHWAENKAEVAAKLKAVGIDLGKNSWFGDPASVQAALKDNFASTLQQIRAFSSRPAAIEVQLASKNFANPNLQPEANLKIIGQTVGTMRWERAMINDWRTAKRNGWQDPQDFQEAWMQKNPIQPFIDSATKEIGPLKGMRSPSAAPNPAPSGPDPKVQKLISEASIQATAKKYGHTEDQVKANLRAQGYSVP